MKSAGGGIEECDHLRDTLMRKRAIVTIAMATRLHKRRAPESPCVLPRTRAEVFCTCMETCSCDSCRIDCSTITLQVAGRKGEMNTGTGRGNWRERERRRRGREWE